MNKMLPLTKEDFKSYQDAYLWEKNLKKTL